MGPHSSGTRLLTRILNAGGFSAYHRSLPAAWPHKLNDTPLVFIHRQLNATVCSQVHNGHASSVDEAYENYEIAWDQLLTWKSTANPLVMVTYENLVNRPTETIKYMAECLGVEPWEFTEELVDGNVKWEGKNPDEVEKAPPSTQTVFVAGRKS